MQKKKRRGCMYRVEIDEFIEFPFTSSVVHYLTWKLPYGFSSTSSNLEILIIS